MPTENASTTLAPELLRSLAASLLRAEGVSDYVANLVADALVAADQAGKASHGVLLLPMYLERVRAGSVSKAEFAEVAHDGKGTVVLDAKNVFGQVSARQASTLAIERARRYGLAMVTVRNAFHFGEAGYWARQMADAGCIGVAMANTRPLMPAPGGAERVLGNNPMAIAMPHADEVPVELDMAMSASAMGKIRIAQGAGQDIPEGWATDAQGTPTRNAAEAIRGMLLPAAGPKGFGLAFMIDLLCGGLSDGGVSDEIQPLYDASSTPYNSAQAFLAIDASQFGLQRPLDRRATELASKVRLSKAATGTTRLYSPGEIAWQCTQANRQACPVSLDVARQLTELARAAGVSIPSDWQSL
ncbi:MAG: Ldh family oxidoreductase [Pandoraea sp.]|nr:Ldh family oxidoreductase [Pandoraea sp.]MDR3398864.1 Ldh family oxidoreductase [Pandoraea sp.]